LGSKDVPPAVVELVATLDYPFHFYIASFTRFEEVQRIKKDEP
jgi:hypothetical protein